MAVGLLISLWSTVLQAQNEFQPEWDFGINAGVTSSSVSFVPRVAQGNLQQLQVGATVRYLSEKNFGLQGELNLSQRGWKEEKDDIPTHKFSKQLLYAEMPVMTHIYFNLGKRVRLIFNMGPQISYLVSEKVKESDIVPKIDFENTENYPIQYNTPTQTKFDWGIIGGGGLELRTGIGSFVVEGRYFYGLADIYKNSKKDYYAQSSNQVLGVKLTYFYNRK